MTYRSTRGLIVVIFDLSVFVVVVITNFLGENTSSLTKKTGTSLRRPTQTYLLPMPLLRSYLCIYGGLQHTSAALSSPSIILSIYGRNFLPLAYSLQKIGVHIDEDGKIIVDVMHWYELNLKALRADEPRLLRRIYVNIYQIIFACPSSQDEVAFGIVFTTIQMHNNTVPCNNQLRTRKDYAAINNMQQSTWTV